MSRPMERVRVGLDPAAKAGRVVGVEPAERARRSRRMVRQEAARPERPRSGESRVQQREGQRREFGAHRVFAQVRPVAASRGVARLISRPENRRTERARTKGVRGALAGRGSGVPAEPAQHDYRTPQWL